MLTNFYLNVIMFDQHRAKDTLVRFFETVNSMSNMLLIALANSCEIVTISLFNIAPDVTESYDPFPSKNI